MADNFHKIKSGISLDPNLTPTNPQDGDLYYDGTLLKIRTGGTNQTLSFSTSLWLIRTTNHSAAAGVKIFMDTTSGSLTLSLPSPAFDGDTIEIVDPTGNWGISNLTIGRVGGLHSIDGVLGNFVSSTPHRAYKLIFYSPTNNWIILRSPSSYGV